MERDEPQPAQPSGEPVGEPREDIAESSGYVTTKQAAKALGVSRRTVQAYVSRGELEAVVEGEGVEKTFYVSIDSLNALRERRRIRGEDASRRVGNSPGASAAIGGTANVGEPSGERAPDLLAAIQDLQYRLGRAEARAELQAVAESTLQESLNRERQRADALEVEAKSLRSELEAERSKGFWRRLFGG
jgi:excisionase family DNA binding protein